SRFDAGVGRLIEILQAAGVYDDTLIVVTGDHGTAFPGAKTTVYEAGLHVPLIVRNPYQEKRGIVSDALISFVDLTPTLLDFAGAKAPIKFHGRSLLPTLASEHTAGWDELYASHTFHEITMYYPMRVVRTRTHKLIWNIAHPLPFPFASDLWESPTWQAAYAQGENAPYGRTTVGGFIHRPKYELYEIATDPNETKNVADDPAQAETLKTLVGKLHEFQKRTSDPWELKQRYE
ncbi:MAG TPA: sulfatase/phosphatase domain-containing protein, partial [Pirellulales bacterium]